MSPLGLCIVCGQTRQIDDPKQDDGVPRGVCARCEDLRARPSIELAIFIPSGDLGIAPASAIVGWPPAAADADVEVTYEGNVIGSAGLELYEDRLARAAGRLVLQQPSRARMTVPGDALVAVGVYDARIWRISRITDPDALDEWLATAPTRWCACGLAAIPCYRDQCAAGWHHSGESHGTPVVDHELVIVPVPPDDIRTLSGPPDLAYGHHADPGVGYSAAWGARLLIGELRAGGTGIVWDRQATTGPSALADHLLTLLNASRLATALDTARAQLLDERLRSTSRETVTLHDDDEVRVIASPRGSAGYLYVTAVLKRGARPTS